ncbi:amidohydrolase 3 [Flagelloscypha sp. PMI_526]|nr:amidohydrolase 3 [Flagelloscypha sp. PMI_526]
MLHPLLRCKYVPKGAIVVPGLSDSHAHMLEYGAMAQLPLEGTRSIPETVARVRDYILSSPTLRNDTTKWIRGGGWDHTVWPKGWPSAADLEADPIVRGRPIVLQSKDCHALWLSDVALQTSLPFPDSVDGGIIERDRHGVPTGLLLDNAQELFKQPELTENDLEERFMVTVSHALKLGLTLKFFKKRAAKGKLPLRVYGMTYFDEHAEYWGNTTEKLIDAAEGTLTQRAVKIFTGALRTGGAALHEPYHDNPSFPGFLRIDPEVLYHWIPLFLRDGWQVNVHAIGDKANGIVLDVFEHSLDGVDVAALRPRLEHAQIMTREDMERLGKLGVIASVQPTHATSDMSYAEERLGPERVKNIYAFRSILDAGARLTFGSDFPVESMNPLSGFYAAISRLDSEGNSPHGPDGWFANQRLSREEALRGMTIDPAYASYSESTLGSIEPGKHADFVVLNQNIMTVSLNQILDTKVLATVIDGEVKFGSLEDN